MIQAKGYAAHDPKSALSPFAFQRREVGPRDVQIQILYCGVCHSDIHQARDEWGGSIFPMVPGHEIVGRVINVGPEVKAFKAGDLAGVGCMVDSCKTCQSCQQGFEQYCEFGFVGTYNSIERETKRPTYGGYSNHIVVDEDFTLRIPENLDLAGVAPLLCAGITTYSPLKHWRIGKGHKLGVMGLGGLGHMAVKIGASLGAEVTVLSTSPEKKEDAKALGAQKFVVTKNPEEVSKVKGYFDFIINTVSANHNLNDYTRLLKLDGTMILLGVPPIPSTLEASVLIGKRRRVAGSLIGGIAETQEMLDYCSKHNITSDVEVISISEINEAYERMIKGDVKYRFVIDMSTL